MDKFETHDSSIDYGSNGMILIASFVVLLVACFVVVLFHVYGPCFQGRRLNGNHRLNASTGGTAVVVIASPRGLDACAMHAIPTFIYESKGHQESPRECAVCLSEFEIGEMGRVLPECQHCFHVDCIDMWLRSHSDCPLCRAQVKVQSIENPVDQPVEDPNEISVFIHESDETGYGLSIGLNSTCQSGGIQIASSSSKTPEGPGKLPGPINRDPTNSEVGSDSIPNSGLDIESGLVSPVTSRVIKKLSSI